MARIRSTELTSNKLTQYLFRTHSLPNTKYNWNEQIKKYIKNVRNWDSSFMSTSSINTSDENLNLFTLIGNLLFNDVTVSKSFFSDSTFKQNFINKNKSTSQKQNPLDFLGFFSDPYIETKNTDRIKKILSDIISELNKIEDNLTRFLQPSSVEKYIQKLGTIVLDDITVDATDPVSAIFELSYINKIPTNTYLTSLIKILTRSQKSSNLENISKISEISESDISQIIDKILRLTGIFKNNSIFDILNSQIVPFISNHSSIFDITNFTENSSSNIIKNILNSNLIENLQNNNKKFSYKTYTNPNNLGMLCLNTFSLFLTSIKYINFYLQYGYSKLFKSDETVPGNNKIDSDGYVTVNGKRFFDIKNATPEQIKKYQESTNNTNTNTNTSTGKADSSNTNNITTGTTTTTTGSIQSSSQADPVIKQLQNDVYTANYIIKNGKMPDSIPKLLDDGKIGPVTKKLFKEFKETLKTLPDITSKLKNTQTDNFGEYEKEAAKLILDTYKDKSSAVSGIAVNDPKMEDFLGVPGNTVENKFSEYIIKGLVNSKNDELAWKLTNLFKTQFGKPPTDDELKRALDWIQKIKNEKTYDAWVVPGSKVQDSVNLT